MIRKLPTTHNTTKKMNSIKKILKSPLFLFAAKILLIRIFTLHHHTILNFFYFDPIKLNESLNVLLSNIELEKAMSQKYNSNLKELFAKKLTCIYCTYKYKYDFLYKTSVLNFDIKCNEIWSKFHIEKLKNLEVEANKISQNLEDYKNINNSVYFIFSVTMIIILVLKLNSQ